MFSNILKHFVVGRVRRILMDQLVLPPCHSFICEYICCEFCFIFVRSTLVYGIHVLIYFEYPILEVFDIKRRRFNAFWKDLTKFWLCRLVRHILLLLLLVRHVLLICVLVIHITLLLILVCLILLHFTNYFFKVLIVTLFQLTS